MTNLTYDQLSRMNPLRKSGSSCNFMEMNASAKNNTLEKQN